MILKFIWGNKQLQLETETYTLVLLCPSAPHLGKAHTPKPRRNTGTHVNDPNERCAEEKGFAVLQTDRAAGVCGVLGTCVWNPRDLCLSSLWSSLQELLLSSKRRTKGTNICGHQIICQMYILLTKLL